MVRKTLANVFFTFAFLSATNLFSQLSQRSEIGGGIGVFNYTGDVVRTYDLTTSEPAATLENSNPLSRALHGYAVASRGTPLGRFCAWLQRFCGEPLEKSFRHRRLVDVTGESGGSECDLMPMRLPARPLDLFRIGLPSIRSRRRLTRLRVRRLAWMLAEWQVCF